LSYSQYKLWYTKDGNAKQRNYKPNGESNRLRRRGLDVFVGTILIIHHNP